MLLKTHALILVARPYRETSFIVECFTSDKGRVNGIISGVRKRKAKNNAALLQPGFLIELLIYYKPKPGLFRIKEWAPLVHYAHIPYKVVKSSVAIFIAELVRNTTYEDSAYEDHFIYLRNIYEFIDRSENSIAYIPILVILQWTKLLGFGITPPVDDRFVAFDPNTGTFVKKGPQRPNSEDEKMTKHIIEALHCSIDQSHNLKWSPQDRRHVLHILLNYMQIHLPYMRPLKSTEIISQVLNT